MEDVAETGVDDVLFGDTQEGCKGRWVGDIVCGKSGEGIDLVA